MAQLQYPLHCVVPADRIWPELAEGGCAGIDEPRLSERAQGTTNEWVLRTCLHLREAGEDVTLSDRPRDASINLVAPRDFGRRIRGVDPFIVVPRADGHRPMLANFTVVQSAAVPCGPDMAHMPVWPQADIRAREHARRTGLTRLGFKGRTLNLDPEFRSQSFIDMLSAEGVELVLDSFDGLTGAHAWGDYSDIDAVFAIRNLTLRDALHKPPSKLVNAWFGEVPALLGPEPAFQAIRRSPQDFLDIRTPQDVLTHISALRENPALFEAIVETGRTRREAFSVEALRADWIALFNSRVGPAFERWHAAPRLYRLARWSGMMLSEPASKRIYRRYVHHGQRILDASA